MTCRCFSISLFNDILTSFQSFWMISIRFLNLRYHLKPLMMENWWRVCRLLFGSIDMNLYMGDRRFFLTSLSWLHGQSLIWEEFPKSDQPQFRENIVHLYFYEKCWKICNKLGMFQPSMLFCCSFFKTGIKWNKIEIKISTQHWLLEF